MIPTSPASGRFTVRTAYANATTPAAVQPTPTHHQHGLGTGSMYAPHRLPVALRGVPPANITYAIPPRHPHAQAPQQVTYALPNYAQKKLQEQRRWQQLERAYSDPTGPSWYDCAPECAPACAPGCAAHPACPVCAGQPANARASTRPSTRPNRRHRAGLASLGSDIGRALVGLATSVICVMLLPWFIARGAYRLAKTLLGI